MGYEAWIWTELLAFDNAQADQGAAAYLERLGFAPKGISLLVSASDFVMLHEGLDREAPLFPDVCSRFGHAGNEQRQRQAWTNRQLRALIANLRGSGVEVFGSVFAAYHRDRYHREWVSEHPELLPAYDRLGLTDGINVLGRLAGGAYYGDLFARQLVRVMQDYGFDGWHGADSMGPGGPLSCSDCSDAFMAQFAEYLGDRLPADWVRTTGHDPARLQQRMDAIWRDRWPEWCDFNADRWAAFWRGLVLALRPLGKKTMMHSAGTKGAFESLYSAGLDYRRMAALGVDYLVADTVAANLALISGGRDRHFELAAVLAEMKALVPEMKVLFLHGVKDVVESYDLLRHAPARLEREVYTLANQYYRRPDSSLARCADGLMVCLGDGLEAAEWAGLRRHWETGFAFEPVQAGELTWVFDDGAVDRLRGDYPEHGTWPGVFQVARLAESGALQIACIGRAEHAARMAGPILVPNFDLCSPAVRHAVLSRPGSDPTVLLGNLHGLEIPLGAGCVSCQVADDYCLGCLILYDGLSGERRAVPPAPGPRWSRVKPPASFLKPLEYQAVPEAFWIEAAAAIRRCLEAWSEARGLPVCRVDGGPDGVRVLGVGNAQGVRRMALVSRQPTYARPGCRFSRLPCAVRKISGFPYTPLALDGPAVVSGHKGTPLHIPPYGIVVMDVEFEGGWEKPGGPR